MSSIINATTTAGVSVQGDNSGSLQLATNNGTTALTIDTSQNVGIGTSSPSSIVEAAKAAGNTQIRLTESSDSGSDTALFYARRSRGTSLSSPTAIQSGNNMGGLAIGAYNGTAYAIGSRIIGVSNQTWTGSAQGTYLTFSTTADGATSDTERMRIASDGTISTTIGSTLYGAYSARAWVNFNGTGTVAIRTSRNVSSITDSGTGQYTVNFTTSMPDGEYSLVGTTNADTRVVSISSLSTSGGAIRTTNSAGALEDQSVICVTMFR